MFIELIRKVYFKSNVGNIQNYSFNIRQIKWIGGKQENATKL